MSRDLRRVRLDREQRPELLRRDPEPLLRRRCPSSPRGVRTIGGPGYQSAAQFYTAHFLTPYIRQVDVWGGYTAAAGHQLYTARSFPKKYWNRIAFITEPTAHLVGQGIIEKQGAGFVTRDGWNLLAGAEEWVVAGPRAGRPRRRRVGRRLVQLHQPAQPDAARPQQRPGQRLRDVDARQDARPHLPRRLPRRAGGASRRGRCRRPIRPGCVAALTSDNMLWRLHAQRLLVERGKTGRRAAARRARRAITAVDAVGTNGAALPRAVDAARPRRDHVSTTTRGRPRRRAGARTPGGRRAQGGGDGAAGVGRDDARRSSPRSSSPIPDLHTRLAVFLRLAELPASTAAARPLYAASLDADQLRRPLVEPRALHRRAAATRRAFLTEYQGDPTKLAIDALPIALAPRARPSRLATAGGRGARRRLEGDGGARAAGNRADSPAFDGVVWFTRQVDWPAGARGAATGALRPRRQHRARSGSTARASPPPRVDPTRRPQPADLRGAGRAC